MQKTPFQLLNSDLGVSGLGGVLMYNPWKPQETLLDTSVLQPVLQATQDSTTCLFQTSGTGYFAFVLPQYSTAHLVWAYFRKYNTAIQFPVPGTVRHLVHLVQALGSPCTFLIQYYMLPVLLIYFLYFSIRLMTTCDLCQLDLNWSDFVLETSRPKFDSCRGYTTPPVIPLLAS